MQNFKVGQKVKLPSGRTGTIEAVLDFNEFHGQMYSVKRSRKAGDLSAHVIEGSKYLTLVK